MKLLVLSDLHLENGYFEPQEDAVEKADVIVLAGDIHPAPNGIEWARQTFGDKPIVYVAGNHEYFECEWDAGLRLMRATAKECGVHFLENDAVVINGVRFLGCTLWTDFEFYGMEKKKYLMERAEVNWPDYSGRIKATSSVTGHLRPVMTMQRFWESRTWLQGQLPLGEPSKTVVVTHHYPHQKSTSPKFANDAMNVVFGSHVSESLMQQASLWIHGHVHSAVNYRIGDDTRYVRVIANPKGYSTWANDPENDQFSSGYLVEQLADGHWAQHHEF